MSGDFPARSRVVHSLLGGREAQTGMGPWEHVQLHQAAVGLGYAGPCTGAGSLSGFFGVKGAGPGSAQGPRSRVGLEATESEGWKASRTSCNVRRVGGGG